MTPATEIVGTSDIPALARGAGRGSYMKFGDSIERFGILKKLSAGGMGTVYLGFDPVYEEVVALKVLFEAYSDDPLYIRRFQREVAVLGQLNHPNIVRLIDSGVSGELRYMVLEFVRGKSLVDVLEERKKLPLDLAMRLIKDVGRALSFAHSRHIIHRDIKPENVMVVENSWAAKILDFGVAYAADDLVQTAAGHFVGTLNYAPPEQVKGLPIDERADLYSFGLLCYEMLTGRNAINGLTQESVLSQQMANSYEPPCQLEPNIPQALSAIILKLLNCDPALRYSSADEVLRDISLIEGQARSAAQVAVSIYSQPELLQTYEKAISALDMEDLDLASRLGLDLIRESPQAAEVHFLLGRINVQRDHMYKAIQDFVKATALDPANVNYRMALAAAYRSLGMAAQAKSEYEAALSHDPTNNLARDAILEMSNPEAEPMPVPPVAPAGQATSVKEPVAEPEPDGPPPDIRPTPRVLRKPLALRTLLWWGWGFSELGARDRMHQATVLQVLTAVAGLLLLVVPQIMHMKAAAMTGHGFHFPGLTVMQKMIAWFYVLGTALHVIEVLNFCQLHDLSGKVVSHKTSNRWVTLNLGKERGVKLTAVFNLYQSSGKMHRGLFLGRVLVQEVTDDSCGGTFLADSKQVPKPGDEAVALEAIRMGLGGQLSESARAMMSVPDGMAQVATASRS
jgi:serine/threonine protein kinase